MSELFTLFWAFAQVGVMTFGGGMAMLPILQREIVAKRGWATDEEVVDYFAIGQCTPGIIAVNLATFIGYKRRGVIGGIIATLGVVFPSVVIISFIAACLQNFADNPYVQNAFAGIRVCVCVLILIAVEKLWKKSVVDRRCLCIFAAVLILSYFTNVSSIILVLLSGLAGIVLNALAQKGGKQA